MNQKPILVTGAHRSGSTWTGKIICESKNVRYVHEPFNISIKKYNAPLSHWFQHVSSGLDNPTQIELIQYINSFKTKGLSNYLKTLSKTRSLDSFISFNKDYINRFHQRTLYKDPIALSSAEWFYFNLKSDVIITIRHPAAFFASLRAKDWHFDFNNFLIQKDLMKKYLFPFQEQIEMFAINRPNLIHQGILIWNCLYQIVLKYREQYIDDWYFVRHEDLSRDPVEEFRKIFDFLNLQFDEHVRNKIIETTTSKSTNDTHRNALDNIKIWKKRLGKSEIELIKTGTDPLWREFYSEKDW
nr:sulfotransferase domain-containing protein [Lutimonas saemankumensis]